MGHHTGQDKPVTLDVRPDNIPDELKAIAAWVDWQWRKENRQDGKEVWKKPPCHPVTNNPRYKRPEGQSTFDRAYDRWRIDDEIDGVGVVLTETGLVGIDIDDCITERRQIDPRALELIDTINSYSEASPSFTGLHILLAGEFDGPDCFIDYKGLKVEIYRKRYLAVTGRRVKNTPAEIKHRQLVLDGLLARRQQPAPPKQPKVQPAPDQQEDRHIDQQPTFTKKVSLGDLNIPPKYRGGISDDEVIRRAKLQKGGGGATFRRLFTEGDTTDYPSTSEAEMALIGKLPFWVNDDVEQADRIYRQSALYRLHRADRWNEWRGPDSTYGRDTIIKAIVNHYMEDFGYYGYARKETRQPR